MPEAWVFETGTNQWRKFDAWPPRSARPRSLFLQPHGGLAFDPPAAGSSNGAGAPFDEYVSDPAHPVEYVEQIGDSMAGDYMIQDQRIASRRPDVLVYSSGDLEGRRDDRRPDPGAAVRLDQRAPTPTGSSS